MGQSFKMSARNKFNKNYSSELEFNYVPNLIFFLGIINFGLSSLEILCSVAKKYSAHQI